MCGPRALPDMSESFLIHSIKDMLRRQSEQSGNKLCSTCTQDPSTGEVKPTDSEIGLDGVTSEDSSTVAVSENMAGDVEIEKLTEIEAVNERGQRIAM